MNPTRRRTTLAALSLPLAAIAPAFSQQLSPGVSKDEILIGSVQDLSGPIVAVSKPFLLGMQMKMEQINAAGGVGGRKLRLIVEDHAYDPKKAVIATEKLLSSDKVFAVVGTAGSSPVLASMPIVLGKGALHLFPLAAMRESFEPFNKLKFAMLVPYDVEMRGGMAEMLRRKKYQRVAILYQDEQWGLDIVKAAEGVLQENKMQLAARASYKRGATEFSSQAQRLKEANPDLIVIGTAVRESIGAVTALRQLGYSGDILGTQATFHKDVAKLGGAPLDGLMALSGFPMMYRDDPKNSVELNKWMDAYTQRAGLEPDQYSATGYLAMEMVGQALQKVGPQVSTDATVAALESLKISSGYLGNPEYVFGPNKHSGAATVRLSAIQGGRWVAVADRIKLD